VELHRAVLEQRRSHSRCLVVALDEVTLVAEDLQEPINDGSRSRFVTSHNRSAGLDR
jgi:hypothetical protein